MIRNKKMPVFFALVLTAVLLLSLTGCAGQKEQYITSIDDMKDRALVIGYPDDLDLRDDVLAVCPKAIIKPQSDVMAIGSVASGKLDCYIAAQSYLDEYLENHPEGGLTALDEPLVNFYSGLGLSDTSPVKDFVPRVNACIAELKKNGILDDMERRWMVEGDETMPDIARPANPSYTLRVATFGQQKPNTYVKDNELVGYDIELAYRVAAYLGCGIRFDTATFPSMLMGIAEGKYDMIASNLYITGERLENITFSDAYLTSPIAIIVKSDPGAKTVYNTLDDVKKAKNFGTITGTIAGQITLEYYPQAEIFQFSTLMDEISALSSGKLDAVIYDAPTLIHAAAEHPDLKVLPDLLKEEDYHFLSAKTPEGETLMAEFDDWLDQAREDGTLDELEAFWTGTENPSGRIKINNLPAPNGTLRIGFDTNGRPDCFYCDNEPVGYPIELAVRFCEARGYGVQLVQTRADAFINSLQSGKIDMYAGYMSYSEEREENVTFSGSVLSGGVAVMVRNEKENQKGLWQGFKKGFINTFVKENRWKMMLSGFGITLLITAGGFALANLLGAAFCALALSKRKTSRVLADIYSRIMQGTPIVVILMLLYYVVFAKSSAGGVPVAVLGFGLSTGAVLAQLFYGGITSVDKGQIEASLALGFTKWQTVRGIILPQTVRTVLPGYFSALIALLKGTSIVGYIAVIDMTKASDIIRSSTYEAFFPLIAVAAVYFAVTWILLSVLKALQKKLAPKRVKRAEVKK